MHLLIKGQAKDMSAAKDSSAVSACMQAGMQRIVADLLSSRQKQYATLRGDEHEVWLSKEGGSKSVNKSELSFRGFSSNFHRCN